MQSKKQHLRRVYECLWSKIFIPCLSPSSLPASSSRMFNNSQTEKVRIVSAGGVTTDNIFIQACQTEEGLHDVQRNMYMQISAHPKKLMQIWRNRKSFLNICVLTWICTHRYTQELLLHFIFLVHTHSSGFL